jgi:hypothetical protein
MNKTQINKMISMIANHFGMQTRDLIGRSRKRQVLYPRYHLIQILKTKTVLSLSEIGKYVGGRDHSTIIHAIEEHESLRNQDTAFFRDYEELQKYYNNVISVELKFNPYTLTEDQLKEYVKKLVAIHEKEQEIMKQKELLLLEILNS